MTKQVMEQALEALRRTLPYLRVAARRAASPDGYHEAKADLDAAEYAIAALKEAIKQAGEPVRAEAQKRVELLEERLGQLLALPNYSEVEA